MLRPPERYGTPAGRQSGVALVVALLSLVVLSGLMLLLTTRTVGESRTSGDDAAITQTLFAARGGAYAAGVMLTDSTGPVRSALKTIVAGTASTSNRWAYGGNGVDEPEPAALKTDLANVAAQLQAAVDAQLCGTTYDQATTAARVAIRFYVTNTACGQPLPTGVRLPAPRFVQGSPRTGSGGGNDQEYALPFVLVSDATLNVYRRNVVVQGELLFELGRSSFARYLGFFNVNRTKSGAELYSIGASLFDGPMHTNEHFRFWQDPWFGGKVTSAGCNSPLPTACSGGTDAGGKFFSLDGSSVKFVSTTEMADPQAPDYYGTTPIFAAGVDWNSAFIPMPGDTASTRQRDAALTCGALTTGGECPRGVYFGGDLDAMELVAGDENGLPLVFDSGSGQWVTAGGGPAYQYLTGCSGGSCSRYRVGADGRLQEYTGATWEPVVDGGAPVLFNGVVYVEGKVERLRGPARSDPADPDTAPPALTEFAQITVAAKKKVRITGDLTYQSPPCVSGAVRNSDRSVTPADCSNLAATNILGVYSQDEAVLIGNGNADATTNVPDDLVLHGVFMSAEDEVLRVENHNNGILKGTLRLIGGAIGNWSGVTGTFNPGVGLTSGFANNRTYDQRLASGMAPPFFPTTGDDDLKSVRVVSFGQQEQVF